MIKAYFNHKAAIWDEVVAEKDNSKLELMAERLDIEPGSKVLDIGTGTGVFIPFLLSKVGSKGQIVALDFAEEMLKIARSKGFDGNISYLCADVARIPADSETFDSVVCYSSFPHFRDKPRSLEEIHRVTRNGGSLCICHTSSLENINQMHRQIPAVHHDIIPDESEMRTMLSKVGFTDIQIVDSSESYFCRARKYLSHNLLAGLKNLVWGGI